MSPLSLKTDTFIGEYPLVPHTYLSITEAGSIFRKRVIFEKLRKTKHISLSQQLHQKWFHYPHLLIWQWRVGQLCFHTNCGNHHRFIPDRFPLAPFFEKLDVHQKKCLQSTVDQFQNGNDFCYLELFQVKSTRSRRLTVPKASVAEVLTKTLDVPG